MLFSTLVIMFRVLKVIRIQDCLGSRISQKQLFAVACIAAANQCDGNIKGKPLFIKSLSKATFIAMNYLEHTESQQDKLGLYRYEQWKEFYHGYILQMFNSILQTLDLNLDVPYPIDYLSYAIPLEYPSRDSFLALSRHLLLYSNHWSQFINNCLFYHPREMAVAIFDQSILTRNHEYKMIVAQYEQQ